MSSYAYSAAIMDEMPFVDEVNEFGALFAVQRLHEVGQDARIVKPQQHLAAIRQLRVELELQQLAQAFQVDRRNQPRHGRQRSFELVQSLQLVGDFIDVDEPGARITALP